MSWKKKELWSKKDIIDYYHGNELLYKIWGANMHYGYWEKGVFTQHTASLRLNKVFAEKVGITKDDYVLDAGCGVGGNAIYLAKTYGCKVVGITITTRQIDLAKKNN